MPAPSNHGGAAEFRGWTRQREVANLPACRRASRGSPECRRWKSTSWLHRSWSRVWCSWASMSASTRPCTRERSRRRSIRCRKWRRRKATRPRTPGRRRWRCSPRPIRRRARSSPSAAYRATISPRAGPNKVGPNLWGIVGDKIAARGGFNYSSALEGLGGEWGYDELDAFLTKPKTFAPGTKMTFAGLKKPADRANILAFLRMLSESPVPLPGE